jgi:hypothetical protein
MSDKLRLDPIVLVARWGKGCRQYTFDTCEEMQAWAARKPYCNERLLVIPLHDRRELGRRWMPALDAVAFVRELVTAAREAEGVAARMATILLGQAEAENDQCAYWFVSALSKLAAQKPHMRMPEILEFVCAAMPKAAQEYASYAKDTL